MMAQETTKHTPGPWTLPKQLPVGEILVDGSDGRTVARVPLNRRELAVQEANANLIAAAPALLEALEEAALDIEIWVTSQGWGENSQAARRARTMRAAIAAARGEQQ